MKKWALCLRSVFAEYICTYIRICYMYVCTPFCDCCMLYVCMSVCLSMHVSVTCIDSKSKRSNQFT